jgi:predicted site-specific integrase-resolvase
MILNISKRSLQTFRDNGTIPYTQIGHKMYYKSEDIQRIMPVIIQKQKKLKYKRKEN